MRGKHLLKAALDGAFNTGDLRPADDVAVDTALVGSLIVFINLLLYLGKCLHSTS
jgi:hypothetical protein